MTQLIASECSRPRNEVQIVRERGEFCERWMNDTMTQLIASECSRPLNEAQIVRERGGFCGRWMNDTINSFRM